MIIETKWQCGRCNELHDDEDEAIECCRPSIHEVFICPACKDSHSSMEEAISCCDTDPEEPGKCIVIPPVPMPIEQYVHEFDKLNHLVTAQARAEVTEAA